MRRLTKYREDKLRALGWRPISEILEVTDSLMTALCALFEDFEDKYKEVTEGNFTFINDDGELSSTADWLELSKTLGVFTKEQLVKDQWLQAVRRRLGANPLELCGYQFEFMSGKDAANLGSCDSVKVDLPEDLEDRAELVLGMDAILKKQKQTKKENEYRSI